MSEWRRIDEDGVTASSGLAADEATTGRVGEGRSPSTLRLYTYRSHCALVGLFQDVRNEVHLDFCDAHGFDVNRRPTGGGAILMGEDQLGVALCLPGKGPSAAGRPRDLMHRFSTGLYAGLSSLGLETVFRGKNDLEIAGRKIAGLGIHRHASGGLLFHASLLVDLDVSLMLRVLKTPYGDGLDGDLESIAGRTTTVREQLGSSVRLGEVRDEVARGFARTFGVDLEDGGFSESEQREISDVERRKYCSEDWLWQSSAVEDRFGAARRATAEGDIEARVTLAGATIKAVYLRGDFFASELAVLDLERRLRWHSADSEAIRTTVAEARDGVSDSAWPESLSSEVLTLVIMDATRAAHAVSDKPYGCFVTPGGNQEAARGAARSDHDH